MSSLVVFLRKVQKKTFIRKSSMGFNFCHEFSPNDDCQTSSTFQSRTKPLRPKKTAPLFHHFDASKRPELGPSLKSNFHNRKKMFRVRENKISFQTLQSSFSSSSFRYHTKSSCSELKKIGQEMKRARQTNKLDKMLVTWIFSCWEKLDWLSTLFTQFAEIRIRICIWIWISRRARTTARVFVQSFGALQNGVDDRVDRLRRARDRKEGRLAAVLTLPLVP